MKKNEVLLITNKDNSELHCSIFTHLFELNEIPFVIISDINFDTSPFTTVILDQFINNELSTKLIKKNELKLKNKNVFLLISRMLSDEDEKVINNNKYSILSMPINEAEIYNRIINVN